MMDGFFTWDLLLKTAFAFFASVPFAVMLKINKRHLLLAGIGAIVTYFFYSLMLALLSSYFAAAFVSTAAAVIYAEILARARKAPAIIYILVAVIPTVPGGELYYTMRYLIMKEMDLCLEKLTAALEIGLGIAGGIVTASILFGIFFDIYKSIKKSIANK